MTIGEPPRAARVRLPPRPPQTPRQRQQRQPRPLFDNLTTPPAQRHQRPAKGPTAAGALDWSTSDRNGGHWSGPNRNGGKDHAPPIRTAPAPAKRGPQGPRKEHGQTTTPATPPQGPQTGRQRPPRDAAKVQHQPQPVTPPAATKTAKAGKVSTKASKTAARPPHWTPATTAQAGTAARALQILKAQTDHTAQRPDESRTGGGQPEACQV